MRTLSSPASSIAGAVGRAMIRFSRFVQRTCLGLRIPACRIREQDLTNELFHADREVENAERLLKFWRGEQARLEAQIDVAWRDSSELVRRIDALSASNDAAGSGRDGRGESWTE